MKEKILKQLLEYDDEYLLTYGQIENTLKIKKSVAKPIMIELRNLGYVELKTAFTMDFESRNGSGYGLTDRGLKYVKDLGIKKDE